MKKVDLEFAAKLLDLAAESFGNHGCNDYEIPNTPENLDFAKRLITWSDYPEDKPNIHGEIIYLMDWEIMRFLADEISKEASAPPPCPDCGRPMVRREPWVCANCGEEMDV